MSFTTPHRIYFAFIFLFFLASCGQSNKETVSAPTIGFIDFVEDATLAQAMQGFFDALKDSGFSEEKKTLHVIYRNAQGDQPTLLQATDYIISQNPALIATNTTLATVNAVQRTKSIPIFMMVAPSPELAKLTDEKGNAPANLFGTFETLDYIETSITLINNLIPKAKVVGTIYSQSESQSVDALNRLKKKCMELGFTLEAIPVTNSSETQLVTEALLAKNIDVFFALPDNVIFASFETIVKSCNNKNIPILTSEAGLVSRGALASYGAELYKWGYQSGQQASVYLKTKNTQGLKPEIVKNRNKVFNKEVAKQFNIIPDSTYSPL